jgi:nucleotide-binding universal stress UspA family protein
MFKQILLPTDDSELSEAAIQKGIQFAKSINAEVTGFHVIPAIPCLFPSDGDTRGYEGAVRKAI